jgi:Fe-S-cluster containining protein
MELHTRVSLLRKVVGSTGVLARDSRASVESDMGEVTCKPGCANCCYPKILVDTKEGILMYLQLRADGRWNPELRAKLVEADAEMTNHTHYTWALKRKPCPLLDEMAPGRGLCTVHPVRPLGCALTFSVGGDPSRCAEVGYVPGGQIQVVYHGPSMQSYLFDSLALRTILGGLYGYSTLPGAVLRGEAIVEGQLMPEVKFLPHDDADGPPVAQIFDSTAEVR